MTANTNKQFPTPLEAEMMACRAREAQAIRLEELEKARAARAAAENQD